MKTTLNGYKAIFKKDNLEIMAKGLAAKEIYIIVTAINPANGFSYTKSAGWLSLTNTLHPGSKCPEYIFFEGARLLHKFKNEVLSAITSFGRSLGNNQQGIEYYIAERQKHIDRNGIEIGEHPSYIQHTFLTDTPVNFKKTAKI